MKKQILVTVTLGLVLLAMSFLLVYLQRAVAEKRVETVELFEKLASVEANRLAFVREYSDFQTVKEKVAQIERYFYTEQTVPLFLSDLESQARARNISFEITSVHLQSKTDTRGPYVDVEFNAEGSYANLVAFSNELQKKPYRIVFDKYYLLGTESSSTAKQNGAGRPWRLYGTLQLITFK